MTMDNQSVEELIHHVGDGIELGVTANGKPFLNWTGYRAEIDAVIEAVHHEQDGKMRILREALEHIAFQIGTRNGDQTIAQQALKKADTLNDQS